MTTPYWSDFVPNSTFYRILSGFQRTFATGVACRQGTLTPPDTWSRPFGTYICSTCWDQSFSELVVIRISLGTLSILLWASMHDSESQCLTLESSERDTQVNHEFQICNIFSPCSWVITNVKVLKMKTKSRKTDRQTGWYMHLIIQKQNERSYFQSLWTTGSVQYILSLLVLRILKHTWDLFNLLKKKKEIWLIPMTKAMILTIWIETSTKMYTPF